MTAVELSGVGSFERFCAALREIIREERDAVGDRVILNAQTSFLVALNSGRIFSHSYVAALGISAGAPEMYAIKEQDNQLSPPVAEPSRTNPDAKPEGPPRGSITVRMTEGEGAKKRYCELVPKLLRDARGPVAIFIAMHGGYNAFYFREGTGESIKSDDLRSPIAVSYEEMAQMLFDNCTSAEGAIECGHVTLFLDACYQYTVAEQILAQLEHLARDANKRIASYPLITSISQSLAMGEFRSFSANLYGPPWFPELRKRTREDRELKVGELLDSDEFLHTEFDQTTRDPKTLRVILSEDPVDKTLQIEPDGQGVKGFSQQSPAVFGPGAVNLRQKVTDSINRINQEGAHTIPNLPDSNKLPVNTFLEIG